MSRAVFMVGEQRSGSNLLRLMLNQSGELAGPHPPHLLQRLMPLLAGYGDLELEPNFRELLEDACLLVERNPVPWEGMEAIDRDEIADRARERSLVGIFGALMDAFADRQGKAKWICKSMTYIRHASDLDRCFGAPKYVYLHRDPRDVTLSFMKAVVGEKHPYCIARAWADLQATCLAERERIGPGRFHAVSYEALTADPEATLRGLCAFLEIEFRTEMVEYSGSGEARRTADRSSLWKNVTRPVMADNSRKFLTEMDPSILELVESVAGAELDALGYERCRVQPGRERLFSASEIHAFEEENRRLKLERQAEVDPQDRARRQHQLAVLTAASERHA